VSDPVDPHPDTADGLPSKAALKVEPGVLPEGAINPVIVTGVGDVQVPALIVVVGITSCTLPSSFTPES